MKNITYYLERNRLQNPDGIAIVENDKKISWLELSDCAKRFGIIIHSKCEVQTPVVIFSEKNYEMLMAMYGCAYARCFYVPISPEQPIERINLFLSIINPKVIVTDKKYIEKTNSFEWRGDVLFFDDISERDDISGDLPEGCSEKDKLYGIFTSGSTGIPKCIIVSHESVDRFINHFVQTFNILEKDIIGNQAPFDFDVSVKDIFSALITGSTLVIIPRNLLKLPPGLLKYIDENNVTILIWAVSALCQISILRGLDFLVPTKVHTIMFSGEKMPVNQLEIWRKALPKTRFVNLYGPTEITCNCTYYILDSTRSYQDDIPIGGPFEGRKVFLKDLDGKVINEIGKQGEICVAGESLADGYYGNEKDTYERFISFELDEQYYRTYCTGDLGVYNQKRELVFVGRRDFQIKRMGHRIELEDIENVTNAIEGVEQSCCTYDGEKAILTEYYVGLIEKTELRKELKCKLPLYMVPDNIIKLESFPLNKNGKIDRSELKNVKTRN